MAVHIHKNMHSSAKMWLLTHIITHWKLRSSRHVFSHDYLLELLLWRQVEGVQNLL